MVKDCEEVINCGDAGQEGELIQRWVLQKAKCNKPVKRLWISSLTEDAIKEGFSNLKSEKQYRNLYQAGNARDWKLAVRDKCNKAFYKKIWWWKKGSFIHWQGADTYFGNSRAETKGDRFIQKWRTIGN